MNREIDIGFLRDGVNAPQLIQFPYVSTEVTFAVSEKNTLAKRDSIELSELQAEEWILFTKDNGFRIIVDNYFDKIKFYPTTLLETNDAFFLLEMIRCDNKISLLPVPTIREAKLKQINVNAPGCPVRMDAAFLKSKENDFYYEFLAALLELGLEGFDCLYKREKMVGK